MKNRNLSLLLFGMLLGFVISISAGCSQDREGKTENPGGYVIYYLNNEETKLVSEAYQPKEESVEGLANEFLKLLLEQKPSEFTLKKALPDFVSANLELDAENEQLTLNLDSGYLKLNGATEILCRGAIVKTFCQIDGIDYVQFVVDGQPLTDSNNSPIGFMRGSDFIDNTGGETKYEQNSTVLLYFADPDGKHLVETRVKIKYDGTLPIEQLIIGQLIRGPYSITGVKKSEMQPTIPEGTVLNKVTAKDGICYVDFNSAFLNGTENVSNAAVIYSVVNSLAEISSINRVQFSIDGEKVSLYREDIEFDVQFERNLDIIKKKE